MLDRVVPYLNMLSSPGYQSVLLGANIPPADWRFYTQHSLWIQEHDRAGSVHERLIHSVEKAAGVPLVEVPAELAIAPVACFVDPVNWIVMCYLLSRKRLSTVEQLRATTIGVASDEARVEPLRTPSAAEYMAWLWHAVSSSEYSRHTELIHALISAVADPVKPEVLESVTKKLVVKDQPPPKES